MQKFVMARQPAQKLVDPFEDAAAERSPRRRTFDNPLAQDGIESLSLDAHHAHVVSCHIR
jgi:hypothetical protein